MNVDRPEIKPGQIWASNDARDPHRRITVGEVTGPSAGHPNSVGGYSFHVDGPKAQSDGRNVWIRLDRFHTGFRLISDAPEGN